MIKGDSPFTPGKPVPLELFVGRENKLEELIHYMKQSSSGKQENVFLIGNRGIGKSSLANFLRSIAEKEANMVGIHVFLGGVKTTEELVSHVFEKILNESRGENWFKKIQALFGDYVRSVGLFGVSLTFEPPKDKLKGLTKNFPQALESIIAEIKSDKDGLFIALDDINGLANSSDFANWYKSFVDEVAINFNDFPVFIMLIGLPDRRDALFHHQESLTRVFNIIEIDSLSDTEVEEFYNKAFNSVDVEIDENAMDLIKNFSGGLPVVMHEIGDAIFYINQDDIIDVEDALDGVFEAATRIGTKYLEPRVYSTISSNLYQSILRKIGKSMSQVFTRKEMVKELNEKEKKVFDNFVSKLKQLGIIQTIPGMKGVYSFVNPIYPVYIQLRTLQEEEESK